METENSPREILLGKEKKESKRKEVRNGLEGDYFFGTHRDFVFSLMPEERENYKDPEKIEERRRSPEFLEALAEFSLNLLKLQDKAVSTLTSEGVEKHSLTWVNKDFVPLVHLLGEKRMLDKEAAAMVCLMTALRDAPSMDKVRKRERFWDGEPFYLLGFVSLEEEGEKEKKMVPLLVLNPYHKKTYRSETCFAVLLSREGAQEGELVEINNERAQSLASRIEEDILPIRVNDKKYLFNQLGEIESYSLGGEKKINFKDFFWVGHCLSYGGTVYERIIDGRMLDPDDPLLAGKSEYRESVLAQIKDSDSNDLPRWFDAFVSDENGHVRSTPVSGLEINDRVKAAFRGLGLMRKEEGKE